MIKLITFYTFVLMFAVCVYESFFPNSENYNSSVWAKNRSVTYGDATYTYDWDDSTGLLRRRMDRVYNGVQYTEEVVNGRSAILETRYEEDCGVSANPAYGGDGNGSHAMGHGTIQVSWKLDDTYFATFFSALGTVSLQRPGFRQIIKTMPCFD